MDWDLIALAFSPYLLWICLVGVTLGILWGAMPGLSTTMAMALLIGLSAGMEQNVAIMFMLGVYTGSVFGGDIKNRRTLLLIVIIILYVAAAGLVSFDLRIPTGYFDLRLSSYEVISVPSLAAILRIFWRVSVARCGLVALIAVVTLASIFRFGFKILLPGAG